MDKVGLGIITCNRENFFKKVVSKIKENFIDELVVVNDGESYPNNTYPKFANIIQHEENKCVAVSKNDCLKYLINKDCIHLFLMEDDILIEDGDIFNQYIKLSKVSGIKHLNFGYHGPANRKDKKSHEKPSPRIVINFKDDMIKMAVNRHCVGAFSYYNREIIEKIGFLDEDFKNAFEHVEHTFRIIKEELHPPFWWFPDLENSYEYLNEIACSEESSTIKFRDDWRLNINKGLERFGMKHNIYPGAIPDTPVDDIVKILKNFQVDGKKK